ncbi:MULTISPECIES: hypothetical protein [Parachlamydia]|jgi:hypothetical protein|uniref:hypothetical protein n=1 Tax=Parachlamydia TaxID=83551 RepID=UPI0001C172AC|nr:hypothetical protein [Parachlamydia acanthamoebae]EFB41473.1 hypothetical protein pah_c032o035 [Parachlamydia acanthamoebae str. Hall's coccus]
MEKIFRFRPTQQQTPMDRLKKMGAKLWNGFLVTAHAVYDSAAFSLVFIVAGVALAIFYPPLSPAFLAMGVSLFTTTLVVKILDRYHFTIIEEFKTKACTFPTKYAKLHLITFVFAIAISFISPAVGCLAGGLIGIASGLIIQIEHIKLQRKVHAENVKNTKSSFKENLAFA